MMLQQTLFPVDGMLLLYVLGFLWIFWGIYVLVMGLYRAHLNKKLSITLYILGTPFLLIGLAVDTIANIFIATIVFFELPREFLVTTRLTRYVNKGEYKDSWRKKCADFVCDNLLDVFDPSENHCGQK